MKQTESENDCREQKSHTADLNRKNKKVPERIYVNKKPCTLVRCVSQAEGATRDVPCQPMQFCRGQWGFQDVRLAPKSWAFGVTAAPAPAPRWVQRRRPGNGAGGCAQRQSQQTRHPSIPQSLPAFFPVPPSSRQLLEQTRNPQYSQGVVTASSHLHEDHNQSDGSMSV